MGMNLKGGKRPASYDWKWDVTRNQDAAWLGDVNGGIQFTLKDDQSYVRPLNTNFYQQKPLVHARVLGQPGPGRLPVRRRRAPYIGQPASAGPAPCWPATRCTTTSA